MDGKMHACSELAGMCNTYLKGYKTNPGKFANVKKYCCLKGKRFDEACPKEMAAIRKAHAKDC